MKRTIRSILASKSGRKVESVEVTWPSTPAEWVKDSGYSAHDLMTFAWEGWIVKEGAPEVRTHLAKGKVSKERCKQIVEARIADGWRKREASPVEKRLRDAGASEAEIATWAKMTKLGRK